jgi:hypothetical protein
VSTLLGLREYSASSLLGLREYSAQAYFDLRVNESKEGSQVGRFDRSIDPARHWPAESCGTGPASHRIACCAAATARICAGSVPVPSLQPWHSTRYSRQAAPCRRMRLFGVLHCAAAHGFALRRCSSCASRRGTGACSNSTCRRAPSSRRRTPSTSNPARPSHGTDTRVPTRALARTGTHMHALARTGTQARAVRCHAQAAHSRRLDFFPHVCLFVCLFVCLSVCLLGLFVCLFVCLCVCLFVRSLLVCSLVCAREQRKRCA